MIKIGDTDYTYVARTEEWEPRVGTLVAWVPPDSIVSLERPEFAWLTNPRIRAKKLRGIVSYGLLVPAPSGLKEGEDAEAALGVTHYQPEMKKGSLTRGSSIPGPSLPKYDIENFLKYNKCFVPGEPVYVSEKIHGANARYTFVDGVFYCGLRAEWKSEFPLPPSLEELIPKVGLEKATAIVNKPRKRDTWHAALPPEVRDYCISNPGYTVYGEVYGNVQDLKYDLGTEVKFRAFDVLLPNGSFMDATDFLSLELGDKVPSLGIMNYDFESLLKVAEGTSLIASHIREGVVVKPLKERWDEKLGRVVLKVINPAYLEKN